VYKLRLNGITFKLVATFLAMLFISQAALLLLSSALVRGDVLTRSRFEGSSEVEVIAAFLSEAAKKGWSDETVRSALQLSNLGPPRSIFIYNKEDGKVEYKLTKQQMTFEPDADFFNEVTGKGGASNKPMIMERDGIKLIVGAATVAKVGRHPELLVVSVSPVFRNEFNRWNRFLWISATITLTLGLLLVLLSSTWITRRLKHMIAAAREIAKGNFNQQIGVGSKDELGELAETLNRMAQELGSLDRMRKDFLANVSHDLRSPLTSIHGYVEALKDGTIPQERSHHYLSVISGQTKRLIRLVNDLLDMAKLDAGVFDVNPVTFNLTETVRKVLARMESQFIRHRVVFEIVSASGEEIYVRGDPDRIEQVVMNLVQNAIEFSSDRDEVKVMLEKRDQAVVRVIDKGIGMNAEELAEIWDRFYKSDKARSRKNGTGIGLSIVKAIMDKHGSDIAAASDKGKGTVFTFALPLADKPDREQQVFDREE
jgi:signal transduction histidine kinase